MKNLPFRYFYFTVGLALNSFGVAFITKSALGTSQISSIPYVFSLRFEDLSFGVFTFILNVVFILLQIIILRRDFRPVQFLQVAANLLFSAFIDVSMYLLSWFSPEALLARSVSLILGCAILAAGISIEVAPNVIVVPGEGIVRAISKASGREFGKVKVAFDITLIAVALTCSLVFFHQLRGLGIGTVVSAVIVGRFVSLFDRKLPLIRRIRRLCESEGERAEAPEQT